MRTFAYDGPVEWSTFADHLSWLSRHGPLAEPRVVRRPQHRPLRGRRLHAQATEPELRRDGGLRRARRWTRARSASRPGSSSTPGRAAPTDELVRLNKVVGEYGGYYTSHVRNRDSPLQDSIDEFLTIVREGGTQGEISHLNVRHRTGAAEGAWQRAVDTMAAGARGRASTCSPTRRRSGTASARWPGSCRSGCWPTAGRRRASGCATRPPRAPARRVRPLLALHPPAATGTASRLQASPQYPGARGQGLRQDRRAAWALTSGTRTSTSSPPPGPAIESLLLIGELFTDEHLAEMITHPLISLGVDGYTAASTRPRGGRRRTRSASRGTSTT